MRHYRATTAAILKQRREGVQLVDVLLLAASGDSAIPDDDHASSSAPSPSLPFQLLVLASLLAVLALVSLSLAFNAVRKHGKLRWTRPSKPPNDEYVCPQLSTVLPVCLVLFAGSSLACVINMAGIINENQALFSGLLVQGMLWLPLCIAAFAVVCNLLIDFSNDAPSNKSASFRKAFQITPSARICSWLPPPFVANMLLWSIPIMLSVSTFIPFVFAEFAREQLEVALNAYDRMGGSAGEASHTVSSLASSDELDFLLELIELEGENTVLFAKVGYAFYALSGFALLVISCLVLVAKLRAFTNQMQCLHEASLKPQAGETKQSIASYSIQMEMENLRSHKLSILAQPALTASACGIFTLIHAFFAMPFTVSSLVIAPTGSFMLSLWLATLICFGVAACLWTTDLDADNTVPTAGPLPSYGIKALVVRPPLILGPPPPGRKGRFPTMKNQFSLLRNETILEVSEEEENKTSPAPQTMTFLPAQSYRI